MGKLIKLTDCNVTRFSPEPYEQCIVEVETDEDLVFILSDEHLTGDCLIEFPGDGEKIVRKMRLSEFRHLLELAEKKLTGK